MSHDIEDIAESVGETGAAAAAAGAACLSCGAASVAVFCANCGQKHDDLRRSSFILGKEFFKDTFGFDSRMWRTLGLMAAAPGLVPSNYSHGKRSRYTPPIRLFLVVSFLFFLILGLTQTMVVAIEVTKKTPEEIAAEAAERAEVERALAETSGLDINIGEARERAGEAAAETGSGELVRVDSADLDCDINVRTRFFARPTDVEVDEAAWRACAESLESLAVVQIDKEAPSENTEEARQAFGRVVAGISSAVEDPRAFNAGINEWLPRLLFLMTPLLALIMALFIRGRDALLFDHLVLSLYSHAAAFAIVGAAIVAGQFGAPYVGQVAGVALGLYFILAMKRAYKRGWVKTVLSAAFISLFYFIILSSAVVAIVSDIVWRSG